MDALKNYTQTGYSDPYTISDTNSSLPIYFRDKWTNNQFLGFQITGFTGAFNSVSQTALIVPLTAYVKNLAAGPQSFPLCAGLSSEARNTGQGAVITYDSTKFRHFLQDAANSPPYYPQSPLWVNQGDYLVINWYDDNGNILTFSNNYVVNLTVMFGGVNKNN